MGAKTILIGPDEPANYQNHRGVFSAHYDSGRLVYHSRRDPLWAKLAADSMQAFPALQAQSGIEFYNPSGYVFLVKQSELTTHEPILAHNQQQFGFSYQRLSAAQLSSRFPQLAMPEGFLAFFESAPAGHINPRKLIAAQLIVAQQQGLRIERETVGRVETLDDRVKLHTLEGHIHQAKAVLVAVGSFAGCFNLLPQRPALQIKSEMVTLGQVSAATAQELAYLPSLGYSIRTDEIEDIYLVPPVLYPDGHFYFKLGSNTHLDRPLPNLEAIQGWMQSQDDSVFEPQRDALQALFPSTQFQGFKTHHCLISRTPNRLPYIAQVAERSFVALGCNGTSAMSSNAIGGLASRLVLGQAWEAWVEPSVFRMIEA